MPKRPLFDCETLFPRIAAIIREAKGYIASYDILLKLAHDPVVREIAPDSKTAFRIAEKAAGLFGQHYTMERTKYGMDEYRREFVRKRDGNYWAYKVKKGYMAAEEYAPLSPVVEEIKELLSELANTEDDLERIRLRKEVRRRGFRISEARDYLKRK